MFFYIHCVHREIILTINVPVLYVARDVMILMRANPSRGPLEGPTPSNGTSNGFAPIKIIMELDLQSLSIWS